MTAPLIGPFKKKLNNLPTYGNRVSAKIDAKTIAPKTLEYEPLMNIRITSNSNFKNIDY